MSLTLSVRSPCLLAVPERSNLWLALRAFPVLVFGMHHGNEYGRPQRDNHGRSIDVSVLPSGSNPVGWLVGFEPGWLVRIRWLVSNPVGWFRTRGWVGR